MRKISERIKNLPDAFGVYLLRDEHGHIIYVGKSNSIKKRIASHLRSKLADKIYDADCIETSGELSALILEAKLIKKYKPKYNVLLRDDKQYPYIKLTASEEYPRLIIARKIEQDGAKYYGPFRGGSAREIMKLLGKLYSLRRCKQGVFKRKQQPCLNFHLKRCLGPCIGRAGKHDYRSLVAAVERFFEEGIDETLGSLKKEMKAASDEQNFEKAAQIRNKIIWLERAADRRAALLENKNIIRQGLEELSRTLGLACLPERIEAFDISNIGSSQTVGAMAVFKDGAPYKKDYRKFIISVKELPNDTAAIYEVVYRRYAKSLRGQLPLPDLIVIDGGRGQLSSAEKAMAEAGISDIPVIGLAKKQEEIFDLHSDKPIILPHDSAGLLILRHIRDEVHRFAISFHRAKRNKAFRE